MIRKVFEFVAALIVITLADLAIWLPLGGCSSPPTPAQISKAESDLCQARAAFKVIETTVGGKLDPAAGSPRARLEAAEDAFCLSRAPGVPVAPSASATPDAGP